MAQSRKRIRAKKKPRRKRRAPRRLRIIVSLGLAASVSLSALLIVLYVTVTARFDGRLWTLPSHVYSDVLTLTPGEPFTAAELASRLSRCGYARIEGVPTRAGEYRTGGGWIEFHGRAFSSEDRRNPAQRAKVRFSRTRVVSLVDERGHPLRRVLLEPERLATFYGPRQEERRLIRLDAVPPRFIDAVLAAEDARFYSHHGFDLRGILRAALANVRQRRIVQGGSTITQQTAKNLFLVQERSWWRKIRELSMAPILDARYSKDRILEVYLNEVYLGQRGPVAICGVQAASRFYFGRSLQDLTLAEWATLAGLIRGPGTYNPFVHPGRAVERRGQVLDAMRRLGTADSAEVSAAQTEKLVLASGSEGYRRAPYAVDTVRGRLGDRFPHRVLREEGLRIYTTIDTRIQEAAETALRTGLERLEREVPQVQRQSERRRLQGAVVVTDPETGAIRALVGGRDHDESQFNRAVQARRQPGSCFKPFVFAAGFELSRSGDKRGLTAATLLDDRPLELRSGGEIWRPANYDRRHRGLVSVRQALEQSLNVPTVRAAQRVGLPAIIDTARRCGIRSDLAAVPSLALGTSEVTPLELAEAYGTFALRGERIAPWIIRGVTDHDGNSIQSRRPERTRAISRPAALLVDDLLHGVMKRGTGRSSSQLGFRGRAAGKTGTTDDTRDAWFVGYTRDRLALVWVGYDDNARTGLTGATGALPIWTDVMIRAGLPEARLNRRIPDDLVVVRIDPSTGALARPRCPEVVEESFVRGSEPVERCPEHVGRFRRFMRRLSGKTT